MDKDTKIEKPKTLRKILSFWPLLLVIIPDLWEYLIVVILIVCYATVSFISNYHTEKEIWRKISTFCFVINVIALILTVVPIIIFMIFMITGSYVPLAGWI